MKKKKDLWHLWVEYNLFSKNYNMLTYKAVKVKDFNDDLWWVSSELLGVAVEFNLVKDESLVPGRAERGLNAFRLLAAGQEAHVGKRIYATESKNKMMLKRSWQ